MCREEVKKIGAEPEDEGEEIVGEINFPILLILKLLNSWNTKLAKDRSSLLIQIFFILTDFFFAHSTYYREKCVKISNYIYEFVYFTF